MCGASELCRAGAAMGSGIAAQMSASICAGGIIAGAKGGGMQRSGWGRVLMIVSKMRGVRGRSGV